MSDLRLIKTIALPELGAEATCQIYSSRRARRGWIRLSPESGIRLIVPARISGPEKFADQFLKSSYDWIKKQWQRVEKREPRIKVDTPTTLEIDGRVLTGSVLRRHITDQLTQKLLAQAAQAPGSLAKVIVRSKRRSWGSCTRRGTVSLNSKLFFLPLYLQEYVMVHELAHLQEFNHSKAFWQRVAAMCPDYRQLNKELKRYTCD